MSPRQAADRIGCSVSHVRHLVRIGAIWADRLPLPMGGYRYNIPATEVRLFLKTEHPGGWPRGKPRNPRRKS